MVRLAVPNVIFNSLERYSESLDAGSMTSPASSVRLPAARRQTHTGPLGTSRSRATFALAGVCCPEPFDAGCFVVLVRFGRVLVVVFADDLAPLSSLLLPST